jgi:hypothetical protein
MATQLPSFGSYKRLREDEAMDECGIYKDPSMYKRFKKNEMPSVKEGCHIRNGVPRGVNDLAEIKTREICRVIYPLNTSGSKQIIIAMDPNDDFFPVVTIGKPGWSGYQISLDAFGNLVKNVQFINDYFNNPSDNYASLQLSASDMVTFRKNWGKYLICISNVLDSSLQVTIAKSTWDGLVEILPLLTDVVNMYQRWQGEAMLMFIALAKRLRKCLPSTTVMNLPIVDDMVSFKNTLRGIDYYSVPYDGQLNSMLNLQKLFREMQYFCAEYFASYIPCLEEDE